MKKHQTWLISLAVFCCVVLATTTAAAEATGDSTVTTKSEAALVPTSDQTGTGTAYPTPAAAAPKNIDQDAAKPAATASEPCGPEDAGKIRYNRSRGYAEICD